MSKILPRSHCKIENGRTENFRCLDTLHYGIGQPRTGLEVIAEEAESFEFDIFFIWG